MSFKSIDEIIEYYRKQNEVKETEEDAE